MKLVYFTHSLISCWNHGNAHFLRGVLRELIHAGHEVSVYEPVGSWSLRNLLAEHGEPALMPFRRSYPDLSSVFYDATLDLDRVLDDADVVVVHEWNEPWLVAAIGRLRRAGAAFLALFHDTHHRAVSDPDAIGRLELEGYDGVLAFGETLAEVYRKLGWGSRVFVWHEAADTRLFRLPVEQSPRDGLVWIGNWGDEERSQELERFLLRPAHASGLALDIYGVRYPAHAVANLRQHGAHYRGWIANADAPQVFARHLATVHVPRRFYAETLVGIPTIRVFEALACGIPLICAPWQDSEGLFRPGRDYLVAHSEAEMRRHLHAIRHDRDLADALIASGLERIRSRHTCAHRAAELAAIADRLGMLTTVEAAA